MQLILVVQQPRDAMPNIGSGIIYAIAKTGVQYSHKYKVDPWTGKTIVNQSVNIPAVRTEPQNLAEQLSLKAAKNGGGIEIMKGQINDPARQNWQKMQYTHPQPDGSHIVIHYWRNPTTGETNGFKFK